jgi:hypothetical protein
MKTIQTKPDCTLGFLPTSFEGELQAKEIIGKLSEISEDQARELMEVDKGHIGFGRICNYLYGLKESAKAVGIEEKDFDKYLVVKL